jgi:glycogen(starch) synthase
MTTAPAAGPSLGGAVLRVTSVFEARPGEVGRGSARFDPVGGMQNHTAALSRALDAAGVEQVVVTARLAGPTGGEPFGARGRVIRVGVRLARFRQLWALCALPAVLDRGRRVALVHAHQGEDLLALPLGLLAARWHRCPLVATVHCSVRHTLRGRSVRARFLRRVGGPVERGVLRRAAAVIVLADRTRRLLLADGVPGERVRTIPSGFEPALFGGVQDDVLAPLPHPRVGYLGRLVEQKRPDLLVRAFGSVTPPANLVVVGDGPLRGRVAALAAASPAADRITLRPAAEHSVVPAVLASLDLLVLPSAYEELGSVLVEAMASGLPVVATRVGGIPEVVEDGRTGLLVPPGDVPALAAAIDRVLHKPGLAQRLGRCAAERSAAWSWPALARRVADVYRVVTAAPAGPR